MAMTSACLRRAACKGDMKQGGGQNQFRTTKHREFAGICLHDMVSAITVSKSIWGNADVEGWFVRNCNGVGVRPGGCDRRHSGQGWCAHRRQLFLQPEGSRTDRRSLP